MICRSGLSGRARMILRFGIIGLRSILRRMILRVRERGMGFALSVLARSRSLILRVGAGERLWLLRLEPAKKTSVLVHEGKSKHETNCSSLVMGFVFVGILLIYCYLLIPNTQCI